MSSRTRRAHGRRAPRPRRDSRSGREARPARPRRDLSADRRAAPRETSEPARPRRRPRAPRTRPRRGVRANETRSATTRPPLASRFARIRSASTSRPATASAAAAAAPPANARAPERASHSACQPPTARSCSCASSPSRTPAWACARRSHATASVGADGIPLLRHRRGTASRRLGDLAHLGLGEEHDVAADLRGRPCGCIQRRAELRETLAVRVPGEQRLREPEFLCVEADDLEGVVSEGGEGSRGATELGSEALVADGCESPTRLEHGEEPPRRLQPERRRHRLLEERARRHRRRAMSAGELRAAVREAVELGQHERGGVPRDEHRSRVDDVLARRSQVDVLGRVGPHRSPELADERLGRVPDGAAVICDARSVEEIGTARLADPRGGVRRDEADCDARLRQGVLRIEHPLQPRSIRDCVSQLLRDEDRCERSHTAKNVVWPAPWRTTSKRSASSSARATRVARSSGLEPEEHGILGVRRLLVGEVHAGRDALEETASEDPHEEVRRLEPAVHPRNATRLHGDELEAAGVHGSRATEAGEPALERKLLAIVRGMGVAAGRVRLPDLDHPVGDGISRAVEEHASDADRARVRLVHEAIRDRPAEEADREVRPDRLRRRQPELSHRAAPRAVSPRGPRARCRSGSRAPSRARSARARTSRSAAPARARRGWS